MKVDPKTLALLDMTIASDNYLDMQRFIELCSDEFTSVIPFTPYILESRYVLRKYLYALSCITQDEYQVYHDKVSKRMEDHAICYVDYIDRNPNAVNPYVITVID